MEKNRRNDTCEPNDSAVSSSTEYLNTNADENLTSSIPVSQSLPSNFSDSKTVIPVEATGFMSHDKTNKSVVKITHLDTWKNDTFFKGCKWSPDDLGGRLLTCCGNNKLKIYHNFKIVEYAGVGDHECDSRITTMYHELSNIGTIYDYEWYPKVSLDEFHVAVSSSLGPLHIWDVLSSKVKGSYQMYNTNDEVVHAYCVACSPDGDRIFGGTKDYIFLFDVNRPGKTYDSVETRKYFKRGIISALAVNPTRNTTFAAGSYNKRVGIYDEKSLLCLFHGHTKGVTLLKFSPCGTFLYSGTRGCGEIFCWDLRQPGTVLFKLQRVVKTQQRIYFDITSDGRYVISGSTDGNVYIWDCSVPSENEILPYVHKFQAHNDCTNGVSIHKHKPLLATVSGQYHQTCIIDDDDSGSDASEDKIIENSMKLWQIESL